MTKKEYCDKLLSLMAEGLKVEREGRIRDRVSIFMKHDNMIANPNKYISEWK